MIQRKYDNLIKQKLSQYLNLIVNIMILMLLFAIVFALIKETYTLFSVHLLHENPSLIIAQILFTIIHVELFAILINYFIDGKIMVQNVIELGIISVVREIMLTAYQVTVDRLFAISFLLLVLGVVFLMEKYFLVKK
ncbi:MAG: phosphate-starvation-inducible PsiE family protein [Nitrospirae bacterium]|nr:phosphate-starvation-inducible PsiE family protein [Nitrospirota bacterium]